MMIKGLYVHIPFCDQICLYCDFCKLVADNKTKHEYLSALLREMNHHKSELNNLETLYIGGGTPTSLDWLDLQSFLAELATVVPLARISEYTIEANPNDISEDLLTGLRKLGVNRISLGVQTLSDRLLKLLDRGHDFENIVTAVDMIRHSGITNYNLDFIYGIPGETEQDLLADLDFIAKVKPPHISLYSLIIEPRTKLSYLIENNQILPLSDDTIADYGEIADARLKELGYIRYEISNYALPGHMSKHNLLYWNLEEYLGVGLGAASQYNNHRYKQTERISHYIVQMKNGNFDRNEEEFDPEMEFILLGLRKTEGISMKSYQERFGIAVFDRYPNLKRHLGGGLLELADDNLRLTNRGLDLANQVYLDLLEE